MKLSFCTLGCPAWDLPTIAARAAEYGFDGVELRIGGDKHVDCTMDTQQRAETRRLFEERGVEIRSLSGYTLFGSGDAVTLEQNKQQTIRNAILARDLGAKYVRVFMGEGLPLEGDIGIRAEYLHDSGEAALAEGITVLVETHDLSSSAKRTAEIVKAADSDGVGVLWDIHHTVISKETPEQAYAYLGKHIKHLHMKDATADDKLCHLGEGLMPLREIIRVLRANGYDGYLSYEWEKMWVPELDDPEIAFPKYIAYMRQLLSEA